VNASFVFKILPRAKKLFLWFVQICIYFMRPASQDGPRSNQPVLFAGAKYDLIKLSVKHQKS